MRVEVHKHVCDDDYVMLMSEHMSVSERSESETGLSVAKVCSIRAVHRRCINGTPTRTRHRSTYTRVSACRGIVSGADGFDVEIVCAW